MLIWHGRNLRYVNYPSYVVTADQGNWCLEGIKWTYPIGPEE